MDTEFNPRPYIDALISNWKLLILAAVAAGILGFGVSLLLPPTYEATALVLVINPGQLIQFDPRFETVDDIQRPLQAFPDMAMSDSVLEDLRSEISSISGKSKSLKELRESLKVAAANDPNLLQMSARHRDPEEAARIANNWANIFITQTNEILGNSGGSQLKFYEAQLAEAREDLQIAEDAMVEFEARNRYGILEANLLRFQDAQQRYLDRQSEGEFLIQDIRALKSQLKNETENKRPLPSNELALLVLQMRLFGQKADEQPYLLQLQPSADGATTNKQLLVALESLEATVLQSSGNTSEKIAKLEPQILELQEALQQLEREGARYSRDIEVATETYTSLARKVDEERITSQDTSQGLRLTSQASIPEKPVAPQGLLNGVLAAVVAFVAMGAVILFRQWRRSPS